MNILLDTHVVIWWYDNPAKIREEARRLIEDRANFLFLSPTVLWEISIKQTAKKLIIPNGLIEKAVEDLTELPITIKQIKSLSTLPMLHRDPFDRIMIAQAKADDLHFMTRDKQILKYDIKTIKA